MLARTAFFITTTILFACDGDDAKPAAEAAEPAPAASEAKADAAEVPEAKGEKQAKPKATAVPTEKVNLNTATKEEFLALPGVGPKMAHEFDEYRPYVSIQQFRKEIGKYVKPEKVAQFETLVFVPVDPNASDAETLQQLAGVTAEHAASLVAGRPYADRAAFQTKLIELVGEGSAGKADRMLVAP